MASNYGVVFIESRSAANNFDSKSQLPRLDEDRFIAASKRGQTAAFDELCRSHANQILKITHRITRNREDAEDAVQDSFLSAFIHIRDFDGKSRFSTWLTRIAINSALMILRKKRPTVELSIDDPAVRDRNRGVQGLADTAPDPETYCTQRERQGILQGAIQALRPSIRRALELQKLQGYSLEETAVRMGLTVSAAKSQLFHAKAALRKSLQPEAVRIRRAPAAGQANFLAVGVIDREGGCAGILVGKR